MRRAAAGCHEGEHSWRIRVKTQPTARLRVNAALDILHAGKRTMTLIRLVQIRAGRTSTKGKIARCKSGIAEGPTHSHWRCCSKLSHRRAHVGISGVDARIGREGD
jgi:hypothetical protein